MEADKPQRRRPATMAVVLRAGERHSRVAFLPRIMDLKLRDKVAIVTGGSRGLGRAICRGLAEEGAKVVINYFRHRDQALELAEEIQARWRVPSQPVRGDVARLEDIRQVFDTAEERFGAVDILINNAGIWPTAQVKDLSREQWDLTQRINLRGPFLTCREAVRRWLAAGRPGRIVNVVSQAAFHGSTSGHADYAASKAGLVSLSVSLAREVASYRIYVNCVAPGMMATDMAQEALETDLQRYLERIPLGRIADPAEIARVVVFLASEAASYMTGVTVDVTGGMLMR